MTPVGMAPIEGAGLEHELPALPPDSAALPPPSPEDRLAASREKIRAALQGHPPERAPGPRRRRSGVWRGMRRVLSRVPFTKMAIGGARSWWRYHPWRSTIEFGLDAADELVRPLAQRHPLLLLAGATLTGAALVRLRPLRALSRSIALAGLLPAFRLSSLFDWASSLLNQQPTDPEASAEPATPASAAGDEAPGAPPSTAARPAAQTPSSATPTPPAPTDPDPRPSTLAEAPASQDTTAVH